MIFLCPQVCSHIVGAIKKEAGRLRDDWDVHLCSGGRDHEAVSDTYCFEMMSLVLALSGSAVGRTHLASQYGFIKDLLSLLHTASGRIQRQVIALLRRILPEVRPQTFASLLGISELPPKDFGILARSTASEAIPDIGILDVFLSCISKVTFMKFRYYEWNFIFYVHYGAKIQILRFNVKLLCDAKYRIQHFK